MKLKMNHRCSLKDKAPRARLVKQLCALFGGYPEHAFKTGHQSEDFACIDGGNNWWIHLPGEMNPELADDEFHLSYRYDYNTDDLDAAVKFLTMRHIAYQPKE